MFSCEHYLSIRDKNIRVPPVGHGPVEFIVKPGSIKIKRQFLEDSLTL